MLLPLTDHLFAGQIQILYPFNGGGRMGINLDIPTTSRTEMMMIEITSQFRIRESSPSVTVVCEAVIVTFGASRGASPLNVIREILKTYSRLPTPATC